MAKSKNNTPALGADYSNKMRSRYAEKVKPSGKIYTKSDRRENRMKGDMKEDSKENKFEEARYQGGCLCGAVKFQIYGQMRQIINCHCGQCRRTHGHYAAYSSVEKSKFNFIRDTGLKWFRSSDKAKRGFCQECGASLFYHVHDGDGISVAAGSIDGDTHCVTGEHWFTTMKGDYYGLPEGDKVRSQKQDIDVE